VAKRGAKGKRKGGKEGNGGEGKGGGRSELPAPPNIYYHRFNFRELFIIQKIFYSLNALKFLPPYFSSLLSFLSTLVPPPSPLALSSY
jgi:hypothetical protein